MSKPRVEIWSGAPPLAIPDDPSILFDDQNLWVAYEMPSDSIDPVYAVVVFRGVIEHRLTPINDEGLGKHPLWGFGLQFYSINEIHSSPDTIRWSVLKARQWVLTFKDCTLDVLARDATTVAIEVRAKNTREALLSSVG